MKKFLCDYMCSELGRWLRTAGHDTIIANGSFDDREIFQIAVREHRILITRDKHFKEMDPEGKTIVYLQDESLDEWARQLKEREGSDWLYRPFSRCLKCNCLLEKTEPSSEVPPLIREKVSDFWFCANCRQMFWQGSHTERMLERLKEWQKDLY